MAKFYGSATKSGKVGGSVFVIRHGETIERQYQPVVNNPKSAKQVVVRAALKLLSQMSASLSGIVAFRRQGNISPRNFFTKANFPNVGAAAEVNGETVVSFNVENIDLTGGTVMCPQLVTPTASGNDVAVALSSAALDKVSRVLYALVGIKEGEAMFVLDTAVVETAGINRTFDGTLTMPAGTTGRLAVMAYGICDLTENARVFYENYKMASGSVAASLAAIRNLSINDVVATETVVSSFTKA